jgi:hypothetical protein
VVLEPYLGTYTLPNGRKTPAIHTGDTPPGHRVEGLEVIVHKTPVMTANPQAADGAMVERGWRLRLNDRADEGLQGPLEVLIGEWPDLANFLVPVNPALGIMHNQITIEIPDFTQVGGY